MKPLANPMVFRLALALLSSGLVCLTAFFLVRRLRRMFTQSDSPGDTHPEQDQLPMHTYHAVIQQLKQQKHELATAQQAEQRRTKTSERISAAVLSNLTSGVMFFTPNNLVRQANAAAKSILGFASLVGMNADDLFRDATLASADGTTPAGRMQSLAEAVQTSLRDRVPQQNLEARYVTPAGEPRTLEITLTPAHAPSGEVLGVACLINDKTELAQIQRHTALRGEMSAEMALALRTSLASICTCARQLEAAGDHEQVGRLAADIIFEAAQLDRTIGGFLAGSGAARSAAGA